MYPWHILCSVGKPLNTNLHIGLRRSRYAFGGRFPQLDDLSKEIQHNMDDYLASNPTCGIFYSSLVYHINLQFS